MASIVLKGYKFNWLKVHKCKLRATKVEWNWVKIYVCTNDKLLWEVFASFNCLHAINLCSVISIQCR